MRNKKMKGPHTLTLMTIVLLLALVPTALAGVDVMALWVINGQADSTITTLPTQVGKPVQLAVLSDGTSDYNLYVKVYNSQGALVATPYAHLHLLNQFYELVTYTPTQSGNYDIVASVLSSNSNAQDVLHLQVSDILGCTNPLALNYNPAATKDDGSCVLPICVPGTVEVLSKCWDGSTKDYRVCAPGGFNWNHFSNVCPDQPVCEQPQMAVPSGEVNGIPTDYTMTLLIFPTYVISVNDSVEINFIKGEASDQVSYYWDTSDGLSAPPGFALSGVNKIQGKFTQVGDYAAIVTVTNDCGSTISWPLFFAVKKQNTAPVMDLIKAPIFFENQTKSFTVSAKDVDNDSLTYELLINQKSLVSGITFDKVSGTFTFKPSFDFVLHPNTQKTLSVSFRAYDGKSYSAWVPVTLPVNDVNRVPLAASDDYNVVAGVPYQITLVGSDYDSEDIASLKYKIENQPSHGKVVVNARNGKDVTYTANKGYSGMDQFSFSVTDQMGAKSYLGIIYLRVALPPPVLGCTDPEANNYNAAATQDDGSCTYDVTCVPGSVEILTLCWDGSTKDYRVCAADGHSWEVFSNPCPVEVLGCTDPLANNYNPAANHDDGSCTYDVQICVPGAFEVLSKCWDESTKDYRVCAADGMSWTTFNNTCPAQPVLGCTDPQAENYDPLATRDDGSCTYDVTCVPGSVEILTLCWDGSTKDYRVCAADGHAWDVFSNTCPVQPVLGCTDDTAWNYNPFATQDDGSCLYVMGCTDSTALNYNPNAVKDDGSCVYDVLGCTDVLANNYNSAATKDDGSCTYDINCVPGTVEVLTICWDDSTKDYRVCAANGHSWEEFSNACPVQPILGCMDNKAKNYNPDATQDDGSCTYYVLGCTNEKALNYNSGAEKDDGSCILPKYGLQFLKIQPSSEVIVPGQSIYFEVKVQNNGNIDLRDLRVSVFSYDLGFKNTAGNFNLGAGKTKSLKLYSDLPYDVQSGDYLLQFTFGNDQYHDVAYRQVIVQ
jgi:hypothetical protein